MPDIYRTSQGLQDQSLARGDGNSGAGTGMQVSALPISIRFLVAVLLFVLPVIGIEASERDPAMERLQSLATALQTRSTWTASYSQEYLPPGMTLGEEVHGQVWLGWPDKALFATGDPVLRWMGLSGRIVRLLDFENVSCDDHLLTDEEWERIPLVAVLDPHTAVEQFSIVSEGERGLVLIPRTVGGVARIEIESGQDGLPIQVIVTDPQGAVSIFKFANWEAEPGPPGGVWLPVPPKPIECLGDPE